MSQSEMTSRQRLLAAMAREPVDRFPVWLKMDSAAWRQSQPDPYRTMGGKELLTGCGCDLFTGAGVTIRPTTPHSTETINETDDDIETVFTTPDGPLRQVWARHHATRTYHPVVYPVKNVDDLKRLRWLYQDKTWQVEEASIAKARADQDAVEADQSAATVDGIGPTPLLLVMQELAGPETTVYLLQDEPELMEEVFELIQADQLALLDAQLATTPADTIWMTENTSTTLINPEMFRRWCMPHLQAYGERIVAAGKIGVHHMCGFLGALLEMIDELPSQVNEAFTTPTMGDTTLADGRARMPSKSLIGGTNAALWLRPTEEIVATVAADLAACVDRRGIILTSAGVLPAQVSYEKAAAVVAAFKQLPVD